MQMVMMVAEQHKQTLSHKNIEVSITTGSRLVNVAEAVRMKPICSHTRHFICPLLLHFSPILEHKIPTSV
jgi:hypothetical protein